ncbi:MAG TPA: high-potential iron-sulfur protein [Steroidobacteraceae bacterium]|nr:high-potential iron-sulfur protein [Steroidobacteraceae bacterium]
MNAHDPARRRLLTGLATGIGLAVVTGSPPTRAAGAPDQLPMLQEQDPAAQASKYVSDAHRAKGAEPGASCASCSLYTSVSADAGTCSVFPSNRVAADGWCSAWSSI